MAHTLVLCDQRHRSQPFVAASKPFVAASTPNGSLAPPHIHLVPVFATVHAFAHDLVTTPNPTLDAPPRQAQRRWLPTRTSRRSTSRQLTSKAHVIHTQPQTLTGCRLMVALDFITHPSSAMINVALVYSNRRPLNCVASSGLFVVSDCAMLCTDAAS